MLLHPVCVAVISMSSPAAMLAGLLGEWLVGPGARKRSCKYSLVKILLSLDYRIQGIMQHASLNDDGWSEMWWVVRKQLEWQDWYSVSELLCRASRDLIEWEQLVP